MVIQWIFIGVLIYVSFLFLRMDQHTRKAKIIVLVIVGFLLYVLIYNIFFPSDFDISSPNGLVKGFFSYFAWIGETATKLWDIGTDTVKSVGNAIKLNSTG